MNGIINSPGQSTTEISNNMVSWNMRFLIVGILSDSWYAISREIWLNPNFLFQNNGGGHILAMSVRRTRSTNPDNLLRYNIMFDGFFVGHASGGFNEEVIWISIGMSIAIVILITIALCYLARQRCKKRQEISVRT